VLKGVEADILADGSLDYSPEVRRTFDFVIGSIHSRLGMDEAEMTARMLKAMDDPCLAVLGHPTGRLLLSRDPYPFDVERVLETAAARGVAVEVNADPHRLDLDWRQVRRARELGVTISIGADAHSVAGMANVPVGVGIARKGWLEAGDVLNTRDAEGFLAYARKRRTA
jgi:DNA polymerase (family 10)